MPPEPTTNNQQPTTNHEQPPPGYQPSPGRKLLMIGLCIAALIFLWTYYFLATRQH
ncbi:MAG: hypothetical protein ABSH31_15270 [Bryobacteraceae bacterium]|jgi:hypothetical protein